MYGVESRGACILGQMTMLAAVGADEVSSVFLLLTLPNNTPASNSRLARVASSLLIPFLTTSLLLFIVSSHSPLSFYSTVVVSPSRLYIAPQPLAKSYCYRYRNPPQELIGQRLSVHIPHLFLSSFVRSCFL